MARVCVICGAPLDGRRRSARYCTPKCRIEASRLRRLLDGEAIDGYTSLNAYLNRRKREVPQIVRGPRRKKPHKRHVNRARKPAEVVNLPVTLRHARAPSEARVGRFVDERIREVEGHETTLMRIRSAYVQWAAEHDPEGPVSRDAFERWFELLAPIEDRVRRPTGKRGRPRVVYVGVLLTRGKPRPTTMESYTIWGRIA